MALWTFWLILGAALLIAEVLSQSLTCLYIAIGALAAMACSLLDYGWMPCIATCLAVTTLTYALSFRLRRRILARLHADAPHSATGMDALIGRTGTVFGGVNPRVRIDGDIWQIRPARSEESFCDGDTVRVVGYDSIILEVQPANPKP